MEECIEVTTAPLCVVEREQDLGNTDFVTAKRFLIGMGKADLSACCGCLTFLKTQGPRCKAQVTPANGNRSGGDNEDFMTVVSQRCKVIGQCIQPGAAQVALLTFNQEGRANLHGQCAGPDQVGTSFFPLGLGPLLAYGTGHIPSACGLTCSIPSWEAPDMSMTGQAGSLGQGFQRFGP